MLPCLLLALWDQTPDAKGIGLAMVICLLAGGLTAGFTRGSTDDLNIRQAFLVVTSAWVLAGVFGALPYSLASWASSNLAGQFPSFIDCVFESVSGFSTTGASILTDIESVPRGLLLWRSLTHWLGGMGIVVLSLAILPLLGGGGMALFKAESPGGILPDKLSPRIAETARSMWWVYTVLTVAETFMLMACGMTLFDAVCHSFATVATGGFSTKNTSVLAFNSAGVDLVITFFMFLAGVNFFLHFQALRGKPRAYLADSEFRFFSITVLSAVAIIFLSLMRTPAYQNELLQCLRDSFFTVCAIVTTTGFATADFEVWPPLAKFLLLTLMVMGGSTGSTAGGSKCMRVQIFFKAGFRELKRILHPHAILPLRIGRRAIPDGAVASVLGFISCATFLFLLATFLLATLGIELETAYTAVTACIFNIGPGLGGVGPTDNFGWLPQPAKVILTACMILGRLEVYTVLVLFTPELLSGARLAGNRKSQNRYGLLKNRQQKATFFQQKPVKMKST